jgi:hypothetical protein
MQPLIVTMSSSEGMQLQRRLVETSLFAARPAFLLAFQSSKKQLQSVRGQRPSLFHVTLAARLMCYRSACAVTHPLRRAACILSQRHKLPGRLGGVALSGARFLRAIGSQVAGKTKWAV